MAFSVIEKLTQLRDVLVAGRADGRLLAWSDADDAHVYIDLDQHETSPVGDVAARMVVLHDFGSGPEPVTDQDGLWLYGAFPGTEY